MIILVQILCACCKNRIVLRTNSCLNSWHYLPHNVASQNLALCQGLEDTQRSLTPPIDRAETDLLFFYAQCKTLTQALYHQQTV